MLKKVDRTTMSFSCMTILQAAVGVWLLSGLLAPLGAQVFRGWRCWNGASALEQPEYYPALWNTRDGSRSLMTLKPGDAPGRLF